MTSAARLSSVTMSSQISRSSARSTRSRVSIFRAASALPRIAASGWFSWCAIDGGKLSQHRYARHVPQRGPILDRSQFGQLALGDVDRHAEDLLAVALLRAAARRDPAHVAIRCPSRGIRRRAPRRVASAFRTASVELPRDPPDARISRTSSNAIGCASPAGACVPADSVVAQILVAGHVPDPQGKPRRARRQVHLLLAFLERSRHPLTRSPLDQERRQSARPGCSRIAIPTEISRAYRSHAVGSRNLTIGFGRQRRSSMPQRRIWRQSTIGTRGHRCRHDLRRRRAVQEAHDDRSGLLRLVLVSRHVAAYDAGADERIERAVDRDRGCLRDAFGRLGAACSPHRRRR